MVILNTVGSETHENDAGGCIGSCMICTKEISQNENFNNSPKVAVILSSLFEVLCKYMNWKAPSNYLFDFKTDSFPFCKKCKISLVRLYKLHQRLEGIQGKINQMVVSISGAILQSQNASFEKMNMTKASETEEKWSYYRNLTHKRFRPKVYIGSLSLAPEVQISEDKLDYMDSSRTVSIVEDNFLAGEEFQVDVSGEEFPTNELNLGGGPLASGEVLQEEIGLNFVSYYHPVFNNPHELPSDIFDETPEGEETTVLAINQWDKDNPETPSWVNPNLEVEEAIPSVTTYVHETLVRYMGQPESETLESTDEPQDSFPCDICGRTFSKKRYLVRHKNRLHGEKNLKSSEADGARGGGNGREENEEIKDSKKFVCEICDQQCCNKWSLTRHYLKHSDDRPFGCELCDETFKSTDYLRRHKVVHSGVPVRNTVKQFVCDVCGQKFECLQHLTVHKTWHEKVTCRDCGQSVRKTLFKVHMLVHRKDKQHHCDKCNKSFKSSGDLKRHENSHGRVLYSHECDICGRKFSQQYILLRHKTSCHGSEEVPEGSSDVRFPCKICGYEFSQKYNLSRHEFNVHKLERPGFKLKKSVKRSLFCDTCRIRFSSNFSLLRHKEKIHGIGRNEEIPMDETEVSN